MTYDALSSELIALIPELREPYEKEVEWWDGKDPGPHNFFGDVVTPFLLDLLGKCENEELIRRLFVFFAEMASSEDKGVQEVLSFSVLERLGDDKQLLTKAYLFMSDSVKRLSDEVEQYLGRGK